MPRRASLNVSLNSLRAFEAVVRLGGVLPAAQELGLTPSAISHQLKALEAAMPVPLLAKQGRRAVATAPGAKLAGHLVGPFAAIDAAIEELRSGRQVMTIGAYDTFAANWLLPRLNRFTQERPDIDVRLATSARVVDLERERIDCAIRLGPGGWPGVEAQRLVPQYFGPLVRADRQVERQVPRVVRVGLEAEWEPWPQWQAVSQQVQVTSRELVVSAVLAGTGAGVLDLILMSDKIANGELAVAGARHPSLWSYHFVLPSGRPVPAHVRAFAQWIREEMARTEAFLLERMA